MIAGCDARAAEASDTDGTVIVLPSTTFESSERPFATAKACVVKLFAAAIDQSDSPGWTTCDTPAAAGEAATRPVVNASTRARAEIPMVIAFPECPEGDSRYGGLHEGAQSGGGYPLDMASKRQIWVGGVPIGGRAPGAVPTMRRTETADYEATIPEIRAPADAGADLIRCAVPREKDVDALKLIVKESPIPV